MSVLMVEVSVEGRERPPAGSPVRAEVRDTSLADARSISVAGATGEVRAGSGAWLVTLELNVEPLPPGCTVWAHVDVDRDGRVSKGDFVTTVAYPATQVERGRVPVRVRKV